jgi:hypothetical protein
MDEPRQTRLVRTVLFPSATGILIALLVLDACLIAGHILHEVWGRGPFSLTRFSLTYEGGFASLFGGAKMLAAAGMMWVLARRSLAPIDLAWAFALVTIALDDLLELHEGFGRVIADSFALSSPLGGDPVALAELIVWALIGSVVFAVLIVAHTRSGQEPRNRSLRISGIVGLLVFFAIGVDGFNSFVVGGRPNAVSSLIEDGGELVVMSLVLAYVSSILLRSRPERIVAR